MTHEKKSEIYGYILNQFPDEGIYKITRVTEWLTTNGCSPEKLGYDGFRSFAEDFPEAFQLHPMDDGETYVIIKKWKGASCIVSSHPADSFFGSRSLILNDDIIEMSQQSLYALTKVLGNGLSVQDMKQLIYDRFACAKEDGTLNFFGERYTFPVDCCADGFLVNGIITKNLSPRGKSLYFSFEKTAIFCGDHVQKAPVVHTTRSISDDDKAEIYRLLSEGFPFDQPQHMAAVSKLLTDNNIDRSKFGFIKMKELLAQMEFLVLEDVILGGVPQIMVTLHHSARYSAPQVANEPVAANNELADVPVERLDDFCNLPPKPIGILQSYLRERGTHLSVEDIRRDLCEDFEKARRGGIRFYEGKLLFVCRYLK